MSSGEIWPRDLSGPENRRRRRHGVLRRQIRAGVLLEMMQKEPHGAFDWYPEGCFGGSSGINLGHTYSLPEGVARKMKSNEQTDPGDI